MMKELVLFYSNGSGFRLKQGILGMIEDWEKRCCIREAQSLDALAALLREPEYRPQIGLFAFESRKEILGLIAMRDLLGDLPLLLILPDQTAETVSLAHRLRPRLVAAKGQDLAEVALVLEKMLLAMERPS